MATAIPMPTTVGLTLTKAYENATTLRLRATAASRDHDAGTGTLRERL